MSRLMTLSELYSLLLHIEAEGKTITVTASHPAPVLLNRASPALWVGPGLGAQAAPPTMPTQPKATRHVEVATHVVDLMQRVAQASGISANDAWTEAAQHWIAQRQQDVQELATPAGRELAHAVRHTWATIDDQLRDLHEAK